MLKTLKDLAIAMINATLILLVLCLFLAWKVTNKADALSSQFARNLITVQPLRDDIQAVTNELAALRGDLARIAEQTEGVRPANLARIETRVQKMETQVNGALGAVSDLSQAPARLMDHAIDTAADRLTQGIHDIRNCSAPPKS